MQRLICGKRTERVSLLEVSEQFQTVLNKSLIGSFTEASKVCNNGLIELQIMSSAKMLPMHRFHHKKHSLVDNTFSNILSVYGAPLFQGDISLSRKRLTLSLQTSLTRMQCNSMHCHLTLLIR